MNVAARAISGLAEVPPPKPIPYFAAYLPAAPITALPKDLPVGLVGLILAHLVRLDDGSTQVFTYWGTAEHFAASSEVLRDRLEAQLLPHHGSVSEVSTPPRPWWKKANPFTVILTLAAVAGALSALKTHYDWLLAQPLLLVRPEKSKVEVIESSDLRMAIAVVSQLPRTEHQDIQIAAQLIDKDKKPHPIRLMEGNIAALAGGATKDLTVEGTAPPSGDYTLRVDATAGAGWWRSHKSFVGETRLLVWPKTPRGSIRLLETKPSWARFAGTIAVGPAAPDGLDCELQSQGTPSLKFQNQFRTSVGHRELKWRTAGQLENAIAVLTWSTAAVESMRNITAEFILLGEQQTDWNAVRQGLTLNCYARQEMFNEPKK